MKFDKFNVLPVTFFAFELKNLKSQTPADNEDELGLYNVTGNVDY
jgi:hypothetical protein